MKDDKGNHWWEKTVEYAFILNFLPSLGAAFPLGGQSEKEFGDLLMSDGTEYRLFEFKAERKNIQDEKKKWGFVNKTNDPRYQGKFHEILQRIYPQIIKHEAHKAHWIVYGVPGEIGFKLAAQIYSADTRSAQQLNSREELENLSYTSYSEMLDYLLEMSKIRGNIGAGTSGLFIVGVNGEKGLTIGLSAQEFRNIRNDKPHQDEKGVEEFPQPTISRQRMH
ncbi:hypothetical protein [Castellaniella sp.]|uniref:hypothetical protein n=1 Tax=Castellaniella sp. TaxID=1955812 RepID=UPI002AFFEA48|nr:hypothetical protein [Castellaniella sp.]